MVHVVEGRWCTWVGQPGHKTVGMAVMHRSAEVAGSMTRPTHMAKEPAVRLMLVHFLCTGFTGLNSWSPGAHLYTCDAEAVTCGTCLELMGARVVLALSDYG